MTFLTCPLVLERTLLCLHCGFGREEIAGAVHAMPSSRGSIGCRLGSRGRRMVTLSSSSCRGKALERAPGCLFGSVRRLPYRSCRTRRSRGRSRGRTRAIRQILPPASGSESGDVAVGDDQPSLGVNSDCVRCANSPGPVPVLPMTHRDLPFGSKTGRSGRRGSGRLRRYGSRPRKRRRCSDGHDVVRVRSARPAVSLHAGCAHGH